MVAVDTNVVVRLPTGDPPKQSAAARLPEAGLILRSPYGFDETAIHDAFEKLLGLKKVNMEDEPALGPP
jgi:hypothetical protein